MAESIALYLKINGKDVAGESSIEKSAGEDRSKSIEVFSLQCEAATPRDVSSGRSSVSARQFKPIDIIKKFDRSSPLLFQALTQNQTVAGEFKFFRANPDTGVMEFFFSIKFEHGRVVGVKQIVHPIYDKESANLAPLEHVSFTFGEITWTCKTANTEFTDKFSERM